MLKSSAKFYYLSEQMEGIKIFSDVEGFFFKGFGEGRDIGLTQRSKRGKNNFLIGQKKS